METKEYNAFKTAIKRNNKLSAPMKVLYDKGLLKGKILDYGCGFGEDVNKLKNLGYNIVGYDKYNTKFKIDFLLDKMYSVVTCNYVFNVIQKNEHDKLLKLLKSLGDEIYISVRADKKAIKHNWVYDKDKDVYITTANTYQRFYDEEMIYSYFSQVEYIVNNNNYKLFKIKGDV